MVTNLYHRIHVAVHEGPVDATQGLTHIFSTSSGCIHVLAERVLTEIGGRKLGAVSYRLHGAITKDVIRNVCEYACGYWPHTSYWVGIAEGRLQVGSSSRVIAMSAPSVDIGLDAVNYIVRTIERRTPIWCQHHFLDGKDSEWGPVHAEQLTPLMV